MTVCICLNYIGGGTLGPTIQLTCNPSGTIINQPTSLLLPPICPLCLTVPSGTTSITAYDPVTNCTETINVAPVPNIPCSFGMDVVFSIDYTGSMGPVIEKIKEQVSTLTNSIVTLSNNNYRLGLVIFDEEYGILPSTLQYFNSFTYQSLPPSQKYININGSANKFQAITAMELMSTNNQTSFNVQLSKLNVNQRPYVAKLNQNGIVNSNVIYVNNPLNCVKYQPDGKIILGGTLTGVIYGNQSVTTNRITRLTTSGNLDLSFITSSGFNNQVRTLDINQSGQIVVGGIFSVYQGITNSRIALLNTNGSLDLSFQSGTGFDNSLTTVKFQSDGKIVAGGFFTTYDGNSVNRICRINTDGTIDSSFTIGTGFNGGISSIAIQSDGKILVGGGFNDYNGTSISCICRLNTDGTIDSSFTVGTGFNSSVSSIEIQSDGKILAGGAFTSYNSNLVNRICRLNTDGTIDSSFTVGTGFNNNVVTIKLQSTGKILVGGDFTIYNLTQVNRFCRLNTDGTLDTSFGCGTAATIGANNTVNSIDVDNFDNIAIGGTFNFPPNPVCSPGMVLGSGAGSEEPSDMSIDRIVNYNLAGNFNPSNSKTIILITDNRPGGNDDIWNFVDTNFINNVLTPACVSGGIKVLVVLPNNIFWPNSTNPNVNPFYNLATLTGGQIFLTPFDDTFNVNGVAQALSNLC